MLSGTEKSKLDVRREDILMSDTDMARRYLGLSQIPCKISSPLRDDDAIPSFSLFLRDGDVFWKDFGTGESGNMVSLLARLWHVGYTEALLKLKLDSGQTIPAASLLRRYKGKVSVTSGSEIRVKVREWKEWDKEYWNSYGVSLKMCDWCDVHPISHAFFSREIDGVKQTATIPMDRYAYAYFEWKDGKQSIKLYQPFSQTMKWLSKHDSSVWDLWKQAFAWAEKDNSAVILTSSRKDAMCLWEQLRIPAMSLQGEGYVPKPQVMKQVFDRFQKVYIWYDNDFKHKDDNPGQDNARKLCEAYPELINICIPDSLKCKDPSDVMKMYGKKGKKELKRIFDNVLQNTMHDPYEGWL